MSARTAAPRRNSSSTRRSRGWAPMSTFSSTDSSGTSSQRWNVRAIPASRRFHGANPSMGRWPSHTEPEEGRTAPVRALSRVVFPAPLGPMTPKRTPGANSRDTPSRAATRPNDTVRSTTRSSAPDTAHLPGDRPVPVGRDPQPDPVGQCHPDGRAEADGRHGAPDPTAAAPQPGEALLLPGPGPVDGTEDPAPQHHGDQEQAEAHHGADVEVPDVEAPHELRQPDEHGTPDHRPLEAGDAADDRDGQQHRRLHDRVLVGTRRRRQGVGEEAAT